MSTITASAKEMRLSNEFRSSIRSLNELVSPQRKSSSSCSGDPFLEHDDSFVAPVFTPDDATLKCERCSADFILVFRINPKHHCRACGKLVCGNCSSQKAKLWRSETSPIERVCDACLRRMNSSPRVAGRVVAMMQSVPEAHSSSHLSASSVPTVSSNVLDLSAEALCIARPTVEVNSSASVQGGSGSTCGVLSSSDSVPDYLDPSNAKQQFSSTAQKVSAEDVLSTAAISDNQSAVDHCPSTCEVVQEGEAKIEQPPRNVLPVDANASLV